MAKPIRAIDIYLPLNYNDGSPIPTPEFVTIQQQLLRRFGGVTSVQRPFPLQGFWQTETETFHGLVVVFSVIDFSERTDLECLRYLERLKSRLKKRLDQLEILITVASLLAI